MKIVIILISLYLLMTLVFSFVNGVYTIKRMRKQNKQFNPFIIFKMILISPFFIVWYWLVYACFFGFSVIGNLIDCKTSKEFFNNLKWLITDLEDYANSNWADSGWGY